MLLRDGAREVMDATGGVDDLGDRVVRLCGPTAIVDDPVRALRGVRLAMRQGWRLEPGTEAAIRAGAPLLAHVAAERVRDELVGILGEPRAAAGLRMLDRLGALTVLLPESAAMRATSQPLPHRFDVWEHSIRTVEGVDLLLSDLDALAPWGAALRAHLGEPLGGGVTRRERSGWPRCSTTWPSPRRAPRWAGGSASSATTRRARAGPAQSPSASGSPGGRARCSSGSWPSTCRPMHLAQAGQITRRARFRFFRDLGEDARDLLLLALADAAALNGGSPLAVWARSAGRWCAS